MTISNGHLTEAQQEAYFRMDPSARKRLERESQAVLKKMSPPGSLNLPPMLEEKRWEFGIIDGYWDNAPIHNRVFLYQLEPTYMAEGIVGGSEGLIVAPQTTIDRETYTAPRAIIVSAGLTAQTYLRQHGISVGHTIILLDPSPLRIIVGVVDGKDHKMLTVSSQDISGSVELAEAVKEGEAVPTWDDKTSQYWLKDTKESEDSDWTGIPHASQD